MDPSELIDKQIQDLPDWRGDLVARLRILIHDADPGATEDWKWGTAVWTHKGMLCAVGVFADHVKINFFRGAELGDPQKLFNAGLEAKKTRAIDLHAGEQLKEEPLRELIRAAAALNEGRP